MIEPDQPPPENEDELLDDVDALGGDAEIMESLPDEGAPIDGEPPYDADADAAPGEPATEAYLGGYDDSADAVAADDAYAEALDADAWSEGHYAVEDPVGDAYAEPSYAASASPYDFLDIDAALASVASLGDVVAAREESERLELAAAIEAEIAREAPVSRAPRSIVAPRAVQLRRGQLASVVPALCLMALGAWLTFAATAPETVPWNPLLLVVAALASVVLSLMAYWLSSGRWSRGAFFFGVLLLLVVGFVYYESTLASDVPVTGSLVLAAVGLAFALTGLFARPMDRRLILPGILFLVAAAVNVAAIIGYLPSALLVGVAPYWPALVVVLALLWFLPAVARRRS